MALRGDVDEAVRSLKLAGKGEQRLLQDALDDPDFDAIRQAAPFRRLLREVSRPAAAQGG